MGDMPREKNGRRRRRYLQQRTTAPMINRAPTAERTELRTITKVRLLPTPEVSLLDETELDGAAWDAEGKVITDADGVDEGMAVIRVVDGLVPASTLEELSEDELRAGGVASVVGGTNRLVVDVTCLVVGDAVAGVAGAGTPGGPGASEVGDECAGESVSLVGAGKNGLVQGDVGQKPSTSPLKGSEVEGVYGPPSDPSSWP